jgi:hypothetical protein
MIQLRVLSGSSAGKLFIAKAFPFLFGRSALAEPGVFDRHFEISFTRDGYRLAPAMNAPVIINGRSTNGAILLNGDIIEAGGAKLEFALSAAAQKGLGLREAAAWMLIVLVAVAQAACIVWLLGALR